MDVEALEPKGKGRALFFKESGGPSDEDPTDREKKN